MAIRVIVSLLMQVRINKQRINALMKDIPVKEVVNYVK